MAPTGKQRTDGRAVAAPSNPARGADDRFKLLRKRQAVCAKGTAHPITFHKRSLFWGFLRTVSFQTSRLITAKQWESGLPGRRGVTPEHFRGFSLQRVRGAQALNASRREGKGERSGNRLRGVGGHQAGVCQCRRPGRQRCSCKDKYSSGSPRDSNSASGHEQKDSLVSWCPDTVPQGARETTSLLWGCHHLTERHGGCRRHCDGTVLGTRARRWLLCLIRFTWTRPPGRQGGLEGPCHEPGGTLYPDTQCTPSGWAQDPPVRGTPEPVFTSVNGGSLDLTSHIGASAERTPTFHRHSFSLVGIQTHQHKETEASGPHSHGRSDRPHLPELRLCGHGQRRRAELADPAQTPSASPWRGQNKTPTPTAAF